MKRKYSILLVSNLSEESPWPQALRQALLPLGTLQLKKESKCEWFMAFSHYDIIIIDAGTVKDVPGQIDKLQSRYSDARLIVMTDSPTWQGARLALLVGATDYLRKSLDENLIRNQFQAVVEAHTVASTDQVDVGDHWRS